MIKAIRPCTMVALLLSISTYITAQEINPLNLNTMKTGASIFVMESLGDDIYFDAWMPGAGHQLWKTDGQSGISEVALMLSETLPGVNFRSIDRVGENLIIEYLDEQGKYNIIMYDGSDTTVIVDKGELRTDLNILGDQAIIEQYINNVPTLLLLKDGEVSVLKRSSAELRIPPVREGEHIYFSLTDLVQGHDSLFHLKPDGELEYLRGGQLFGPLKISNAGVFYEPNDSLFRIKESDVEFIGEHVYRVGQVGSQLIGLKRIGGDPSTLVEIDDELREIATINDVGSIYPLGDRAVILASRFLGGDIIWGYDSNTGVADSILYVPTTGSGLVRQVVGNFADGLLIILKVSDKGDQLWYTDGTKDGTRLINEPDNSGYGSIVFSLGMDADTYYFAQSHPEYGIEPWYITTSDFSPTLLADIHPGKGNGIYDIHANTILDRSSLINGSTLYVAASLSGPSEQPQLMAIDLTSGSPNVLSDIERSDRIGPDAIVLGRQGEHVVVLATPDSFFTERRLMLVGESGIIQPTGIVLSDRCEFHAVNDEFGYFLDYPVIYRFHFADMSIDTIFANFNNTQGVYATAVGTDYFYVAPRRRPSNVYKLPHTSNELISMPAPPGSDEILNHELRVVNGTLFLYRTNFPVQLFRYDNDIPEDVSDISPVISWESDNSYLYVADPVNTYRLNENLEGDILFQGGDLELEGGILISSASPDIAMFDTNGDSIINVPFELQAANDPVLQEDLLFFHNEAGIQYLNLTTGDLTTAFENALPFEMFSVDGFTCGYYFGEMLLRCHNGDTGVIVDLADLQPTVAFDTYSDLQNALYFTLSNQEYGENELFVLKMDITSSTIEAFPTDQLNIYPNPSNGDFTVKGDFFIDPGATVKMHDIQGKEQQIDVLYGVSGLQIRLNDPVPGVYYLTVEVAGAYFLGTVVID